MKKFEKSLIDTIAVDIISKDVEIDGYKIHYIESGKGEPVLLIHGANMGWGQWYPNIYSLSHKYKVYALDLPGSGLSSYINYADLNINKDWVNIIEKFVKINNISSINIIGHSIGGFIAMKLALNQNISINKIVLINSLGFSSYLPLKYRIIAVSFVVKLLIRTVLKPNRKNMSNFLKSVLYNKNLKDEFIEYYYQTVNYEKITHPFLLMNSLTAGFKMHTDIVLKDHIDGIRNQILVVMGKNDPLLPLNKNIEGVKLLLNSRVELFDKSGHVPSIEESDKFNTLVHNFFSKK